MDARNETSILRLHQNIIVDEIPKYLDVLDINKFSHSCKIFYGFFNKNCAELKIIYSQLLAFVASNEQDKVEAIIKKNPQLLLIKGTVTDHAERTFEDITCFQLALWNLNSSMWEMLQKYLPPNEVVNQLDEHLYIETKYKKAHGAHYDSNVLIKILENYIHRYKLLTKNEHNIFLTVIARLEQEAPTYLSSAKCSNLGQIGKIAIKMELESIKTLFKARLEKIVQLKKGLIVSSLLNTFKTR